jgi:Na+/melibiose symporter-like transporter
MHNRDENKLKKINLQNTQDWISLVVLTKNKRLFRIDSCLTLQNSFFFFHLILFSYFIDFVSFRYNLFSYFTDFVISFREFCKVRQESKRNKRLFFVSTTRDIQ